MKKSTSLSVLLLVLLAIGASHVGWVRRDNGMLLDIDGREIDAAGWTQDQWTRLTRSCQHVQRLEPQSARYQSATSLIAAYSPPQSATVRLAGVWAMDTWALAEAEFPDLLPAVVLMDFSGATPRIVSHAVWSGYTKPWKAAPFIRDYLLRQVPDLPPPLAACFEPQSSSFQ